MEKITGMEAAHEVPPKVLVIYEAVEKLIASGEDINSVKVSTITELAGIGKGTVYDYFENKDEIIACSLLYQIKKLTEGLKEICSEKEIFAERVYACLEEIQKQSDKQQCFLRYVHVMTANSGYCQLVRDKMKQKEFEQYLPKRVFEEMAMDGIERGEIKKTILPEYVIYAIFSKLLTYMISVNACETMRTGSEKLRTYLYQSLLDELCEKNV